MQQAISVLDFDKWYWSYGYGSKISCIKVVEASDLPQTEKEELIKYYKNNLGKFPDILC